MGKIFTYRLIYIFILVIILLNSCIECDKNSKTITKKELSINYHTHKELLKLAIDSAQNVIRDSIKKIQSKVKYWSAFELGLPKGKITQMAGYSRTKYKLEGKESTADDYGIITIMKNNGQLVTANVTHDQYITLNPNDVIQ